MKVTYTHNIPMVAKGITFTEGTTYDLPEVTAEYLTATFPTRFTVEPVVEPKKTATRPKRNTKKAIEE